MTASKDASPGDGATGHRPEGTAPGSPPPPSIHFGGDWTSNEKALIRRAIYTFERRHETPPRPKVGATWVCASVHEGSSIYYFASRHKLGRVLNGTTPQDLADTITRFDHSM